MQSCVYLQNLRKCYILLYVWWFISTFLTPVELSSSQTLCPLCLVPVCSWNAPAKNVFVAVRYIFQVIRPLMFNQRPGQAAYAIWLEFEPHWQIMFPTWLLHMLSGTRNIIFSISLNRFLYGIYIAGLFWFQHVFLQKVPYTVQAPQKHGYLVNAGRKVQEVQISKACWEAESVREDSDLYVLKRGAKVKTHSFATLLFF